jgi:SAM-dependent methyltransferase
MGLANWTAQRLGLNAGGQNPFRRRRFAMFLALIDDVLRHHEPCRIIDIGGEPGYWDTVADLLGNRPIHVTLVNTVAPKSVSSRFTYLQGDARNLASLADLSFDIVHSNSVIEHVGAWDDMAAMAREVRRLAPAYFVQTPNFWFPVEPHFRTAFFHWLPVPLRVSLAQRRPRGSWRQAPDVAAATRQVESARLLDSRQMEALFPDGLLRRERVAGLVKSLMAIRQAAY